MTEIEIKEIAEAYASYLVNADGKIDMRTLMSLCKEIERNARNAAVDSIYATATAVNDRIDVRMSLSRLEMIDYRERQAANE